MLLLVLGTACTKDCDAPPVDDINALYLRLKTGGDNGFSEEELSSLYLVRYFDVPGDSLTFPADTLHFASFYEGSDNKIRISNDTPFRNDSLFFVRYNYGFYFEADSNLSVMLTDIQLEGGYIEDCDYENRRKTFRINDQEVNRSGSQDYYEITK